MRARSGSQFQKQYSTMPVLLACFYLNTFGCELVSPGPLNLRCNSTTISIRRCKYLKSTNIAPVNNEKF